jgi:hypothetical protein
MPYSPARLEYHWEYSSKRSARSSLDAVVSIRLVDGLIKYVTKHGLTGSGKIGITKEIPA